MMACLKVILLTLTLVHLSVTDPCPEITSQTDPCQTGLQRASADLKVDHTDVTTFHQDIDVEGKAIIDLLCFDFVLFWGSS